jgi:hypothetical protein
MAMRKLSSVGAIGDSATRCRIRQAPGHRPGGVRGSARLSAPGTAGLKGLQGFACRPSQLVRQGEKIPDVGYQRLATESNDSVRIMLFRNPFETQRTR